MRVPPKSPMKPPIRTALSLAGAAALGLIALEQAPEAGLQASSVTSQPLQDTDGDGLDDYLEARLGTAFDQVDTDQDGATDLEEYLSHRNPLVANSPLDAILASPAVRINLYEAAGTVYLQTFAASGVSIEDVYVGIADLNIEHWAGGTTLVSRGIQWETTPTQVGTISVRSVTVPVAASELHNLMPCSIGIVACVDGVFVGEELQLTEILGDIYEMRSLNENGTNSPLCLFPALPVASTPVDHRISEVCVQSLTTVGTLGAGRLLYTVDEAYCDFLPQAVCVADCRLTQGDTVVGLDIPGLLGALAN